MVTMSSEKSASRRKPIENNDTRESSDQIGEREDNNRTEEENVEKHNTPTHRVTACCAEDTPNYLVYKKMESLVEKMLNESTGVPVKTVKSFMTKTPSVFTGTDLISWMMKTMDIDDQAVYLCKRTMQNKTRLELADYEAENLARLQKIFSRKWEFIFMQAEAQSKVDKKRDKLERKVLDSQERAFWDVHRPMPGCVNTTELDIKKECRSQKPNFRSSKYLKHGEKASPHSESYLAASIESLQKEIDMLKDRLDRRNIKVSKVAEALIGYFEQYAEYDPFFTQPEFTNPWVSDSSEMWEQEKIAKEVSTRRVKRWAFGLQELLQDPIGREQFIRFLEKEFSSENLKFWETVQELKTFPQKDVNVKAGEIWNEFLCPDASCPINVDSRSFEITKRNLEKPDRWCFDIAAAHVYHLMKSDSYSRYLRSEMYKDFLNGSKKKTSVKGIRSIVSFTGRRDTTVS
ncbi:PREDICTED: regulator of G-protein signaling 7 isoform X2 [Polistes dominula]|uniref:Regulator of G-protein signaling 7 isoform X2 n=1 Tax=Polistes dominula TaxID=743375 RepID=A0ABM1JFR2_POLDO|nr:PREDICTED: regulator of G-protein signaling 7 isoform X2 [Polistes dominula]